MKQETLHWLENKVNGQVSMDRTLDVAQSSMTNLQEGGRQRQRIREKQQKLEIRKKQKEKRQK